MMNSARLFALSRRLWPSATALLLGGTSSLAFAHTGHDTQTLFAGFTHPFGLDHLLAMVAVGLWSAAALPAGRRVFGPLLFMGMLLAGSALGVLAGSGVALESAIAASVVLLGVMLAAPRALPRPLGLALIAGAALLHGLAHGAELPAHGAFAAYAAGFLATTAGLHAAGLGAGHWLLKAHTLAWRLTGAALGGTGLWLLLQA